MFILANIYLNFSSFLRSMLIEDKIFSINIKILTEIYIRIYLKYIPNDLGVVLPSYAQSLKLKMNK